MVCPYCQKPFGRRNKGVSCSICTNAFHTLCGNISEFHLTEIEAGKLDWKCDDCRKKSTRRSIVLTDQISNRPSNNINPSKAHMDGTSTSVTTKQKTTNQYNHHSAPKQDVLSRNVETSLKSIVSQLNDLQEGQQATNVVVREISGQMGTLQTISSTLHEHGERIHLVESKYTRMQSDIDMLKMRFEELEQSGVNKTIQINGIPQQDGENLLLIIGLIGDKIAIPNNIYNISAVKRCNQHQQSSTVKRGDSSTPANSDTAHQRNIFPIHATFDSLDQKNAFLTAFRKVKFLYTDDIGIVSPDNNDRDKIFLFEYLVPSLKKTYIQAKLFQRANNFKYLWTRDGKIFLREDDDTKVHRIFTESDLLDIKSGASGTENTRNRVGKAKHVRSGLGGGRRKP